MPINGAVLLLKPNLTIYTLGLNVLQTKRFTAESGFNETGRPLAVLPHRHPLVSNRTWMFRRNTWNMVNGAGDQGLLVHVYLVVLRGRAAQVTSGGWRGNMRLFHFNGVRPSMLHAYPQHPAYAACVAWELAPLVPAAHADGVVRLLTFPPPQVAPSPGAAVSAAADTLIL